MGLDCSSRRGERQVSLAGISSRVADKVLSGFVTESCQFGFFSEFVSVAVRKGVKHVRDIADTDHCAARGSGAVLGDGRGGVVVSVFCVGVSARSDV
jgi:hypothetical protein